MQNQIKMVFLDLDGTIVHSGHLVESAVLAVEQLRENDIEVAICTGRSPLHTKLIRQALGVSNMVCFNGALAIADASTVFSRPLTLQSSYRAIQFGADKQIPMVLHTQDEALIFDKIPSEFAPLLRSYDYPPMRQISHEVWHSMHKELYQMNLFMMQEWDKRVEQELPECFVYRWDEHAVDLQRRSCDKALGAVALLKELHVEPENAVHFGDGRNDLGMFDAMGMSVAMGNASMEVQRRAKMVTSSVDADGVYLACKKLQLIS